MPFLYHPDNFLLYDLHVHVEVKLRWLQTVSSTLEILVGRYYHSLSVDATIMVHGTVEFQK